MRHVIRGGSVTSRRGDRTRIVALLATFFLLMAGMVVSAPGLMSASATSGSSNTHPGGSGGDDSNGSGTDDGHHNGGDDESDCHSGNGDDDSNDDSSGDDHSGDDHSGDDQSGDPSKDDQSGDPSKDDQSGDPSTDDQSGDTSSVSIDSATVQGTGDSTDSSSDGTDDGKGTDDGSGSGTDDGSGSGTDDGHSNGGDDGHDDGSDDGHDDSHHDGHNDDGDDDGDDDGNCATTAALTLNKIVVNDNDGTSGIGDFILVATSSVGQVAVISGADPSDDPAVGISANVPVTESYVLSESGPDGYDASAWNCSAGTLVGDTLTLAAGDVANCTITNDDTPPAPAPATITVNKFLPAPMWGGTLGAGDFQLLIDGDPATQGAPGHEVTAGTHTISEQSRDGYMLDSIVCIDLAAAPDADPLSTNGTVTVAAGQDVECTVFNVEDPATLTLQKFVDNTNGGDAVSSDFHLLIDTLPAEQNTPLPQVADVAHTIGEEPAAGYELVGIDCTDNSNQAPVPYDGGITLALGQHVTCKVTNVSDPVDLAITKTDNGLTQVAGGAAFDYTITVDNAGLRDVSGSDAVTVTDQLPAGMDFTAYPANCAAAGQTLTCTISPADLQVADPPVVITVSVKVHADAARGTYTNMAFVDTVDDPACVGSGCSPVCGGTGNNVACETTDVIRTAGITITKDDNVVGSIPPGATYSYAITVGNTGPSTFPAGNMTMSDDLPVGLNLLSVSAPSPWSCNAVDPVLCTYTAVLLPNTLAEVITLNVQLDPNVSGDSIVNHATATALVNGPAAALALQSLQAEALADDPIVVTATDDETTAIVRTADLAIDKSVSQATATNGAQFNWNLDITNHGPDMATNLVVSDTIPAQFEVIGTFPTAGLSCTNSGNSVQCTAASLANGATVRAVVQVRVAASAAPGAVTNTGSVVATSTDPNTADNSDSASITITGASSLAPVPPVTPPASGSSGVSLPRTGNGSLAAPLSLAGLLLVGGFFSLVIARRRRAATA